MEKQTKRVPGVILNRDETALINTAIWFANLKRLDADVIDQRFKKAIKPVWGGPSRWKKQVSINALQETHEMVCFMLEGVVNYDGLSAKEKRMFQDWFSENLARIRISAELTFDEEHLRQSVTVFPSNVWQCCWLAVGLLLDRGRPYYRRFTQCRPDECGRFVIDSRKRGAPTKYCSERCRKAAVRDQTNRRVQEYNKRNRE